jgi:hypothetical protein
VWEELQGIFYKEDVGLPVGRVSLCTLSLLPPFGIYHVFPMNYASVKSYTETETKICDLITFFTFLDPFSFFDTFTYFRSTFSHF